jgi:uncharacterized protein (TIGR02145 family)
LRATDNDGNVVSAGLAVSVTELVVDADGNTYSTVMIGDQLWTVDNLRTTKFNDGTDIPHLSDSAEWANMDTAGYCYYDNATDSQTRRKWGALYNWLAVHSGMLAPTGWRVPTEADWDTLSAAVNGNAKSLAARTDWESSTAVDDQTGNPAVGNDLTANNSSGFSALPGGCRSQEADFLDKGTKGCWWVGLDKDKTTQGMTSSKSKALFHDRSILWTTQTVSPDGGPSASGYSVRLVKDIP